MRARSCARVFFWFIDAVHLDINVFNESRESLARENGFSGQKTAVKVADAVHFLDSLLLFIDYSIRKNKKTDGLYHAYNLLSLHPGKADIGYLYVMLEGQASALSSGLITSAQHCLWNVMSVVMPEHTSCGCVRQLYCPHQFFPWLTIFREPKFLLNLSVLDLLLVEEMVLFFTMRKHISVPNEHRVQRTPPVWTDVFVTVSGILTSPFSINNPCSGRSFCHLCLSEAGGIHDFVMNSQ